MTMAMTEPVFVFGSNQRGRHGAGAAKWALQHRGARYGQGNGRQGNSYAIPTKDYSLKTLPLRSIAASVGEFLIYATDNLGLNFQVTPIGCGLAGYKPEQIAPMFRGAPPNCTLPKEFLEVLNEKG
jgi:hypothetical protein